MQSCVNFSGLSLTEIFEIQSLQSLLIKFWYLGLTSDCLIAKEDANTFKTIRKAITFANCFTFEMPLRTYISYGERIMKALGRLDPKPIFDVLLGHLKNNKIATVSFQLFGVAFLQLFGKTLEVMNSQMMNQVLREIYVQLTVISKSGTAIMKPDKNLIKEVDIDAYIGSYKEYLTEQKQHLSKQFLNPEQSSIQMNSKKELSSPRDLKTLKGRLETQAELNNSIRQLQPGQYSTGDKMKNKEKANISCFMMGGFEIVDYSESINQLHRKLLTKILLNK